MLAYCCVQLVPIVAIQPCVAQEGLIDHAARVLAAPFSCPTDGENVLDEERLEKEDHDIVKAFLHEEESPKEGIPPKPHKMKDV